MGRPSVSAGTRGRKAPRPRTNLRSVRDRKHPSAEEVADAWADQQDGYEQYFFKNVRNGIRTPDDSRIWHRIEERKPDWLSRDAYGPAIKILRSESGV